MPKPPVVDRQLVTFSCFAKEKVTKKKAAPVCRRCTVPCVAQGMKSENPKPPRGHFVPTLQGYFELSLSKLHQFP
jgi:hypothetical protein